MTDRLTHQAFTENLQTIFQVSINSERHLHLELTEVSPLKLSLRQEEFAIVLRGPGDFLLEQGTRMVDHDSMGSFELFLVPIKQDANGFYYEAVFNRFRQMSDTTG